MWFLGLFVLIIFCYTDLRERGISLRLLAASLISVIILMISVKIYGEKIELLKSCLAYELNIINIIWGLLPGVFLLVINKITREAIGKGDVYVIFLLGFMLGFRNTIELIIISMLLTAVFGVVYIVVCGKDKKAALPYMPFLLIAFLILLSRYLMEGFINT
ncbi:MAG: prepilin peptidase [Lachnospiraceae bacterium]|nr:prepilin peptidase [Lachnospiraceae bacterium]